MLTLALDTVTRAVGLALLEDEELRAELYLNLGRHHAEVLLPALEQICRLAGTTLARVDLLACTTGPGSFTGVRIGVSTVKGLGLAMEKPLVGVSALEALAMNAMPAPVKVCTLLDARKNQVYAGLYRSNADGFPEPVVRERLDEVDHVLAALEGEVIFVGEGAIRYRERIEEMLPSRARFAGPINHAIRAAAVAWIGRRHYLRGDIQDPFSLSPRYLRVSEAEGKRKGGQTAADGQTMVDTSVNLS
jgi:tRNA threonylcarbamoyladenosine biosynthesis protein TsaB